MRRRLRALSAPAVSAALAGAAVLAAARSSYAVDLAISIGVRETGTAAPVGGDGGTNNSIEWVRRDGQLLSLDGTYQTFTFNFGTDPVAFFSGTQPGGGQPNRLDGTRGVLEHIRIRNVDGLGVPVQLYVDNIRNTDPQGAPSVVSDFESHPLNSEVTFQEPLFSGSTSANLAASPNVAAVTSGSASQGSQSNGVQFRFVDGDTNRWLRLTTFAATNLPNPAIDFAPGSTLSFDVRGVPIPEPATAAAATAVFAGVFTLWRGGSLKHRRPARR